MLTLLACFCNQKQGIPLVFLLWAGLGLTLQCFTLLLLKYILQWLGNHAEELLDNKITTYIQILGRISSGFVLNYREV